MKREGQGQFFLTEKYEQFLFALARRDAGETLLHTEEQLLIECEILIQRHSAQVSNTQGSP